MSITIKQFFQSLLLRFSFQLDFHLAKHQSRHNRFLQGHPIAQTSSCRVISDKLHLKKNPQTWLGKSFS